MAVWPVGLQQTLNSDTFREQVGTTVLRSDMDIGPAKVRRRYTKPIYSYSASIFMNTAQYNIFMDFFNQDTAGGSMQFEMNHPITGVPSMFRFSGEPVVAPINGSGIMFSASFTLEMLP